jgi:hypothetical protein
VRGLFLNEKKKKITSALCFADDEWMWRGKQFPPSLPPMLFLSTFSQTFSRTILTSTVFEQKDVAAFL